MDFLLILLIVALLISGFSSFFIAAKIFRMLKAKENKAALAVSIITFIASFCLILWVIAYIVFSNMSFGR